MVIPAIVKLNTKTGIKIYGKIYGIKLNFYLYIIILLSLFIFMITWDQVMLVQLAAQLFVRVALKLFSID